jgi:hypothetical protein
MSYEILTAIDLEFKTGTIVMPLIEEKTDVPQRSQRLFITIFKNDLNFFSA